MWTSPAISGAFVLTLLPLTITSSHLELSETMSGFHLTSTFCYAELGLTFKYTRSTTVTGLADPLLQTQAHLLIRSWQQVSITQLHCYCNFLNATVQTLVPSIPANLNFGYVRTWSTYRNKWGWWICFCCAWLSVSGHEAAPISPSFVDWQNSSHSSFLVLLHDVMTCIMH